MKKVFILLFAAVTLVSCGPAKELTPEEKAEIKLNKAMYGEMFEKQSFVIEAHTLYTHYGDSFFLTPTINFIRLNEGEGTVQLGFEQIVGWNGVGGITLDGKVRNYKVIEGSEKNMPSVRFDMTGASIGSASVRVNVNSSGQATAVISGNFSGDRITLGGKMINPNNSTIYKGTTNY